MSTALEAWLEAQNKKRHTLEGWQAIAVIEKLKEALQGISYGQIINPEDRAKAALAIDPEKL